MLHCSNAKHVAEFGNIVDDYLKRRGWKENAVDRAHMAARQAFGAE